MESTVASGKYEVHALCYRYPNEVHDEIIGGIHVHRLEPFWWVRMRIFFEINRKHRLYRLSEIIQKTLTIPTYPKMEPISTKFFYKAAKRLHKKINFDIVVSEHHGLTTLLTGCKLKENFPDLKHVGLMWDPVKGEMTTMKLPRAFTDCRVNRIEEYVSPNTSLQISFSSMKEYHKKNGDIAADHRVYLGVPGILKPEPDVPTDKLDLLQKDSINIVFSGLLSPIYRDALPIIKLLNQCDDAERINMVFFSKGEKEQIEQATKNFRGSIVYHDYIPLPELHTMYRHADYLLNVSHINPNMVPSKIFEYMSYGRPILSTYVTDGDAAEKFIRLYPEGLTINLKMPDEELLPSLNEFLKSEHTEVSFDIVKELFKENTPINYFEVIDGFCSKS